MAITINGTANTIAGLAVGGLPDNTIDNGCMADDAIGVADLSATGTASSSTYLRGDNSWAAIAGGLTEVDLWRMTSTFSGSSSPITSNLSRANANRGFAALGTGVTESSGIFSFPSTGHWRVTFNAAWYYSDETSNAAAEIQYTSDNGSNWSYAARGQVSIQDYSSFICYAQTHVEHYIDVTNISNQKVRFFIAVHNSPSCEGNSNENRTYMSFQKLADT